MDKDRLAEIHDRVRASLRRIEESDAVVRQTQKALSCMRESVEQTRLHAAAFKRLLEFWRTTGS